MTIQNTLGNMEAKSMTKTNDSWCVIYRVGGRERFEWKRTCGMSQAEAIRAAGETMRMGYPVLIEKVKKVDAIGLPETFDVKDAVTL